MSGGFQSLCLTGRSLRVGKGVSGELLWWCGAAAQRASTGQAGAILSFPSGSKVCLWLRWPQVGQAVTVADFLITFYKQVLHGRDCFCSPTAVGTALSLGGGQQVNGSTIRSFCRAGYSMLSLPVCSHDISAGAVVAGHHCHPRRLLSPVLPRLAALHQAGV